MARKSLMLFTIVVLMLTMVLALGACGADNGGDGTEPGALPETGGELDATATITDTFEMTDTGGTTGGTTP